MPDPVSIITALEALKHAREMAKGLMAAEDSIARSELKLKIAELAESLVNARSAMLDAQEEIAALRARVATLEAAGDLRAELTKRDGMYFRDGEAGDPGPFCVRCFETDKKLMPVSEVPHMMRSFGRYRCPQCKAFAGSGR